MTHAGISGSQSSDHHNGQLFHCFDDTVCRATLNLMVGQATAEATGCPEKKKNQASADGTDIMHTHT